MSNEDELLRLDNGLVSAGEEFMAILRQQETELDSVFAEIRKTIRARRESNLNELEAMDSEFMKEREELLARNRAEYEAIVAEVSQKGDELLAERQKMREEFSDKMAERRAEEAEEYRLLKVRLDAEASALEQQLQEMRATYQLNSDKLSYNLRVLIARDEERSAEIATQKRRVAKLRDTLTAAIRKHNEIESGFKSRNSLISAEVRKVTKQYEALRKSFLDTEESDRVKFARLWSLREAEVVQAVEQALVLDRAITEEVLGLEWTPPEVEDVAEEQKTAEEVPVEVAKPEGDKTSEFSEEIVNLVGKGANFSELAGAPESARETRTPRMASTAEFWRSMADVIPPDRKATYIQLKKRLTEMHSTLKSRASVLEKNAELAEQNEELRGLLGQCMPQLQQESLGAGAGPATVSVQPAGVGVREREMA